ncbi:RNA binding activity-knot of a chromodomain [Phytophthora cinnamomi]|uniref:RNA binding activity-knot of a chromodomain n=1 Tax=Phytophthora cinnamomi TaxID=4785 RepID=UPI0035596972|nr:RNA binding activity-knot of a chromodomain [Phytophthora cinnamomi]
MYVTRRLLRSTMPPEPVEDKEKEEKEKKDAPFLPPPTPKRRAAVRASAKICEVVADASGPAARSRAAKTSPKQTENGGDEKNKSRSHKKIKKKEEKQQKGENETPAVDVSKLHGYQLMVDVHYRGKQYAEARILDLDPVKELLFVHYMGWNARFDAWVPLEEVAAHGSHSGVAKKKDVSWDGDIALFATEEEAAAQRQSGKTKPKTTKAKKRTALSPKARQAARKALESVSTDRKRYNEQVVETEEAQPAAKRIVKKSSKNAKTAKNTATKSPRAGKKVSSKSSPARRAPRRVQVAVGTTDEDSERKNDTETADLVLEVEVEGREASNDDAEEENAEEDQEEEEEASSSRTKKRATTKTKSRRKGDNESPGGSKRKRDASKDEVELTASTPTGAKRSPANKSKKPKKGGAANKAASKPASAVKTVPLPPCSGRGGLGSATREKLAAIFRLRVQQRQQMEQLNASQAGFQQSLQDEAETETVATTTDTPHNSADAEEVEATNLAAVNAELAAAEEYQRQLQQYYYHQQIMLANSLSMSVAGSEDLSTIPLQGGIMDPRIIQERLTALEERRRQQAHVQAYYQQLMLTRERNVRALAANQAFMAASAAVWEQQLKETQSEDGTSSVTSWKDVTGADSAEPDKGSPKAGETATTGSEASGEGDSTKDETTSAKESETSSAAPAVAPSNDVTSPDTVEKAAEGTASAETSPTKSKGDPADTPAENVLYEFVL